MSIRYSSHRWVAPVLASLLLLSGCRAQPTSVAVLASTPDVVQPSSTEVVLQASVSPEATPSALAPTEAPTRTATPSAVPTATNTRLPEPTATPTAVPSPSPTRAPRTIQETENILVLGIDQRPGEGAWRTDTIMVVAVDFEARQVGVISIPRDLWIEIPDYGMGRINQADFLGESQKYPGGGPALAGKLIKDNLGIPVQRFARVKMEGLVQLVDVLGGVTVTLDCPLHEITPDPKNPDAYEHFDLPAGRVELDGEAAKKFATYRYASNDFARSRRQQQLIWAIRDRALQVDAIPKIPELWRTLAKTFATDLNVVDVVRLARLGANLEATQVHGLVFSQDAIEYAVVGGGAQVLRVKDPAQVEKEVSLLFAAPSISQQGREGSGVCPTPLPPPTAVPTVTPTDVITPTLTPTPG